MSKKKVIRTRHPKFLTFNIDEVREIALDEEGKRFIPGRFTRKQLLTIMASEKGTRGWNVKVSLLYYYQAKSRATELQSKYILTGEGIDRAIRAAEKTRNCWAQYDVYSIEAFSEILVDQD